MGCEIQLNENGSAFVKGKVGFATIQLLLYTTIYIFITATVKSLHSP